MPELRLFLKIKHEILRHIIVNFRHRIKLRNFVDTNYLTEMYTYVTAGENKTVGLLKSEAVNFGKCVGALRENPLPLFS
jgi:hypothetical protein